MAKFGNPLGGTLWISQTYHGDQYGNRALDFGSTRAEAPVYAIADGRVVNRSAGGGSWIAVDTANSNIRVWYVHTYKWTKTAGQTVKKGDLIARIAPRTHNGGWAVHLHLGLSWNNGTSGFPNLLDYLDRRITLNTNYVSIANAWFNGTSFDWSKHRNLSYSTTGTSISVGRKVEFTADTNLRVGNGTNFNIKGLIKKGAVGTVIGGPRTTEGHQWWDIKFLNDQGWVANVGGDRMKITDKAITRLDGSPEKPPEPTKPDVPPPATCEAEKKEIETLKGQIKALEKELEDARSSEDFAYGEVKKVKSKLESANLKISTLNDIIKNLEEDILLLEDKLKNSTDKVNELLEIQSKYELVKEKNRKLQDKLDRGIERLTLGELIRGIIYKLRV